MSRTIGFKAFWDAYGKKRDREAAEKAWQQLSPVDRRAAIDGIAAYREACRRDGVAMMYGQGYLSHRRWEDGTDGLAAVARRQAGHEAQLFGGQDGRLPELEAFSEMETW